MSEEPREVQAVKGAGDGGIIPPVEHRWKPGQSGNPAGRKTAGATLREWINSFAETGLTEKQLRKIAKDKDEPWIKRAAASRVLRTIEIPDLADFQDAVDGVADLRSLRDAGLNTEAVKKMKSKTRTISGRNGEDPVVEIEREIELYDRAGEDFDRVFDRTEGKPTQESQVNLNIQLPTPEEARAKIDRLFGTGLARKKQLPPEAVEVKASNGG